MCAASARERPRVTNAFSEVFNEHWNAGTGVRRFDPTARDWTAKRFVDAMGTCGRQVSEDSVANWRKGVNLPQLLQRDGILAVYFGDDAQTHNERERLQRAWTDAQTSKGRRGRAPTPETTPADPLPRWSGTATPPLDGLAQLAFVPPVPANSGGHYVKALLLLGEAERSLEATSFIIGLREAALTIRHGDVTVAEGSRLGGPDASHDHVALMPGGLHIRGPVNERGHLEGDVFAGVPLFHLLDVDPGRGVEVTLSLAAFRRAFHVMPLDEAGQPQAIRCESALKDALINLILEEAADERDRANRAVLQIVRMARAASE
jgi:hypothetical protein